MEFTGERFLPTLQGDIRLEHFHRYQFCLPYVAGKRVLDIACGEGYGSYILARTAASVIGVDISDETVEHAKAAYPGLDTLGFMQGDAASIPLPDHCVDVVVSFETIEHHDRHAEMMSEICRVLTKDGLLILSSPNKRIYSDLAGGNHNHFHVKELYFSELDELLRQHFSSVAYLGQRVTATSLLQPMDTAHDDLLKVYSETTEGVQDAIPLGIEPMYYVALASNHALPALPRASAFLSEIDNPFYEKQREALALESEIKRMSGYIAEVSDVLKFRDNDLAATQERVKAASDYSAQLETRLAGTEAQLHETQDHLQQILNSRSWKLVQALRKILRRA